MALWGGVYSRAALNRVNTVYSYRDYQQIIPTIFVTIILIIIIIIIKKTFKNEQRSRDAATKKRADTSGVGKIKNYYEDIYIYTPPYNNTH